MTDLLTDLRAAKEGSRELSDQVLLAWGWTTTKVGMLAITGGGGGEDTVWVSPTGALTQHRPSPTESVDDALAGVPEGWAVTILAHWVGLASENPHQQVTVALRSPDAQYKIADAPNQGGDYSEWLIKGRDAHAIQQATIPLAICIATLEAEK